MLCFLAREKLRARSLVQAAQPAPQINLPGGIQITGHESSARPVRRRSSSRCNVFALSAESRIVHLRKESRASLRCELSRLFDAGDRDAQIEVIRQSCADQAPQSGILEHLPPPQIRKRIGWRARLTAKVLWHIRRRASVIWPDRAPGTKAN